jgi:hypothetical protein
MSKTIRKTSRDYAMQRTTRDLRTTRAQRIARAQLFGLIVRRDGTVATRNGLVLAHIDGDA